MGTIAKSLIDRLQEDNEMLELKPYPLGARAVFGMLTPSHDSGYGSYEFDVMSPEGVVCLDGRVMVRELSVDRLKEGAADAVNEARKLATAGCNVLDYIGTATCFVLGNDGEDYLVSQMQDATGISCTSGGKAVTDALRFMRVQKILCYTPYKPDVAEISRTYFKNAGFDVIGEKNVTFLDPADVNKVPPLKILADIVRLCEAYPEAEGVFCVGGCFRTIGIMDELEKIVGIPVVGTQQANMWKCLQLAGISDKMPQFGRLLGADRL